MISSHAKPKLRIGVGCYRTAAIEPPGPASVIPPATLYDTESRAADNVCCVASIQFCDPSLIRKQKLLGGSLGASISITSKLAVAQRPALEQLLFFNINQHRVRVGIQQSIDTYGVPEIYEQDGGLRVRVGDIEGVQTLFAISDEGRPMGVAVFVRSAHERFAVLHLGVDPKLSATPDVNTRVLLKLMHEIRSTARRTRGVDCIELVYKVRHAVRLHG
jgi:hypothetical protein